MPDPAETILPRDRTGTAGFSVPGANQTEREIPPIPGSAVRIEHLFGIRVRGATRPDLGRLRERLRRAGSG
ncbi:hypothetical protein TPA0905_35310 [Streptomyces olivaceus]|nr:hypothetical protein TPA0905_35310 [Streptomyces olivaceus]